MDEKTTPPDLNGMLFVPENIREMVKSAVSKLGPKVPKEEKIEHAKVLIKIFEKGMSPKDAMKISNKEIAQIYSFAYHLFSTGRYIEAAELFKMLVLLNTGESEFATALGACFHRLKDYKKALQCYMLSGSIAIADPVPFFYAYDCYLNMNNDVCASIMLWNVIAKAGDQKEYQNIKQRAQVLYDELKRKIINERPKSSEKVAG